MRFLLLLGFFVYAAVLASSTDYDANSEYQCQPDLESLFESASYSSSSEDSDFEQVFDLPYSKTIHSENKQKFCMNISPVSVKLGTSILSLLLFNEVFNNANLCREPNAQSVIFSTYLSLALLGLVDGLIGLFAADLSNGIEEVFNKRKINWKNMGLRFFDIYSSWFKFIYSIIPLIFTTNFCPILCNKSRSCGALWYLEQNYIIMGIYIQLLATIAILLFMPKY